MIVHRETRPEFGPHRFPIHSLPRMAYVATLAWTTSRPSNSHLQVSRTPRHLAIDLESTAMKEKKKVASLLLPVSQWPRSCRS